MCAPSTSCRPRWRSSTASQRLVFHNAAYQRLWNLDSAFLSTPPTDSELLDRLRASRKLPEQADSAPGRRTCSPATRPSSRRKPGGTCRPRTLRVVMNPNPKGGVTYLFDDVSEHILLESQVHALTRVQSETLDTLKEGVAVFGSNGRLKLTNRAFLEMWQLPSDIVNEQPHIDAIIKTCRLLAPQDDAWIDIRGAVAGLADMRPASPAASSGATARPWTAPPSPCRTARRS
jgi:PAS domain-containing protein